MDSDPMSDSKFAPPPEQPCAKDPAPRIATINAKRYVFGALAIVAIAAAIIAVILCVGGSCGSNKTNDMDTDGGDLQLSPDLTPTEPPAPSLTSAPTQASLQRVEVFGNVLTLDTTEIVLTSPAGASLTDTTVPTELGLFTALTHLEVFYDEESAALTRTIPTEIGLLTDLAVIILNDNLLSGSIPTELGLMKALTVLNLSNNRLTGVTPSEVGELSLLRELLLSNDKHPENDGHASPLPSELGRLSDLETFLFSGNSMAGRGIIEAFWNATSLVELDLNDSGFGGTLSTNIGKLTNLIGMKLSRNEFAGTVPSEIGLIDSLVLLWIHLNDLTGEVPSTVCQLRGQEPEDLMFLNADCGTNGGMTCATDCCTGCCDDFGLCGAQ